MSKELAIAKAYIASDGDPALYTQFLREQGSKSRNLIGLLDRDPLMKPPVIQETREYLPFDPTEEPDWELIRKYQITTFEELEQLKSEGKDAVIACGTCNEIKPDGTKDISHYRDKILHWLAKNGIRFYEAQLPTDIQWDKSFLAMEQLARELSPVDIITVTNTTFAGVTFFEMLTGTKDQILYIIPPNNSAKKNGLFSHFDPQGLDTENGRALHIKEAKRIGDTMREWLYQHLLDEQLLKTDENPNGKVIIITNEENIPSNIDQDTVVFIPENTIGSVELLTALHRAHKSDKLIICYTNKSNRTSEKGWLAPDLTDLSDNQILEMYISEANELRSAVTSLYAEKAQIGSDGCLHIVRSSEEAIKKFIELRSLKGA